MFQIRRWFGCKSLKFHAVSSAKVAAFMEGLASLDPSVVHVSF
jgi:hypothetical protein